jgi:ATP-dependent DNA helicase RecG
MTISNNKGENPMRPEKISDIISGGEGLTVEFKQSRSKLNRDVFETVCAFL